jgi:sugar lactone lactonase YvrE
MSPFSRQIPFTPQSPAPDLSCAINSPRLSTVLWLAAWAALLFGVVSAQAQGSPACGVQGSSVFCSQKLGSTPAEQSVSVVATAGGTVNSVEVLSLGANAQALTASSLSPDFAAGNGVSCVGKALAAAASCSQSITFTPQAPGQRLGAVVLLDASGNALGSTYLSGTGTGGLAVLVPGNVLGYAGDGEYLGTTGDGGPATAAEMNHPTSIALDGAGNMYVADRYNNRIRMVCGAGNTATIKGITCPNPGYIITIAGNGNPGFLGDGGMALSSEVNTPWGVALDGAGNLYIADSGDNRVRMISASTGKINTVAGGGINGLGDGGQATAAELNSPQGVTVDPSGNLYIADTYNHRIRKVTAATGIITTVAGNGTMTGNGSGGFAGDTGAAINAELNFPFAVAFDAAGNMYIPDSNNNRVRLVTASSGVISATCGCIISTFAGTGAADYAGDDGPANAADLWAPSGLAIDAAGNLYIADTQNNAIRKVSSSSGNTISTLAANGLGENLYNGSLYVTTIYGPIGLYIDGSGNLYLADVLNMRIQKVQSNFVALDFTKTPIRQGDISKPPLPQTIENDGNDTLNLTSITLGANAALDATTTCVDGPMVVNQDCIVEAVFAPSPSPSLTTNTQLSSDIEAADDSESAVTAPNSPLDIQVIGIATPVNGTTVVVASSLNPAGYGQLVTFTATVGTGQGTLTGSVTFVDGTTNLGAAVPVNASGVATYATPALSVGTHSITASYGGDSTHFDSTSAALTQTVLEGTATNLVSNANPAGSGQSVTFTATVTSSGGGGVQPDGTVVFTDGSATLSSVAVNGSGVATYTTSSLADGPHSILATYNGDAAKQISGSVSALLTQDVLEPSVTAIAAQPNPSSYGAVVTFTANVTSSGTATPTGVVNFLDSGQQIGSVNLAGTPAVATFAISTLAVGAHSITAHYQGDSSNGPGTSPVLTQTVNQATTATALAATPNPGIAGGTVALTATVTVTQGTSRPAGLVTFSSGATSLGSAQLGGNGTATVNATFAAGPESIVATYAGDTDDSSSASAPLGLSVVLATTASAVTSNLNPSLVDAPTTFTAKVTGNGGIPTGTVAFSSDTVSIGSSPLDATGTATLTYTLQTAGTHAITVSYSGDANNQPSASASISQVVGTIPTVTALGSGAAGTTTQQVILVATVVGVSGPIATGSVIFQTGTTVIGTAPLDATGVATLNPNLNPGTYTVIATYNGDPLHTGSTSLPLKVSATPIGFSIAATPASVTMATKQNSTVTVTITSISGFSDTVGLGCASLPESVTCHFATQSLVLAASGAATTQLTIDTNDPLTGGTNAMNSRTGNARTYLAGLFLPLSIFFGCCFWRMRRRHRAIFTTLALLLFSSSALLVTGCNVFSQISAVPGTYTIQVTGTGVNSNIVHYQNVTLDITQ